MSEEVEEVEYETVLSFSEYHTKLEKLLQLLRKRIKLYKDSPPGGSRNWRVNEDIYKLLVEIVKEAGLE